MSAPERAVVMVVDDTPTNIDLLLDILGEDHEVRVALDGVSALEDIASEVPDIILLDIMMPGMDGYEVCRRLKADPQTRNIPVIFVTAKGEVTDEIEGFECGAVDYITKPVSAPVVLARVAAHLALVRQNRILEENVRLREEVDRIGRHDLKTPLNRIISLPRILMAEADLKAEYREILRSIEEAGYTILAMINRSLDIFKMESGTYRLSPEPVDLRGIVLRIASDLSAAAQEKGCGFDITVTDEAPGTDGKFYVSGEPLLCYSLAANLIKNALEASPEGTRVQIRLGREDEDTAVFTVHNSGEVPESIRDRFFEKYSTAGKQGGTGLGTYSAHLMTGTMGGTIGMTTGSEQGTRVRVTLPAASAPETSSPGTSARPAPPWRDRELPALRLLIVDDDADNLNILHRFLVHPALAIDRAADGRQALDMWRNGGYDLILMDLEMPGMDGRAAVTRIRVEEKPGADPVTVLALSAHGDEMAGDCLEAGFDGLLTKPVAPEALHDLILKVADQRRRGSDRGRAEIPDPDVVEIDGDLEDIMPGFLENKRVQIREIIEKIGEADGEEVRRIAHKLKGGFNMYGLSVLGEVCADLEQAAKTGAADEMQRLGQDLSRRFGRLKIAYR